LSATQQHTGVALGIDGSRSGRVRPSENKLFSLRRKNTAAAPSSASTPFGFTRSRENRPYQYQIKKKKIVEIITNDKETGLGLTQTKFFEEAHWRDVRSPVVSSSLPFFVEGVVIQPEREK
jgi:hypothetical protein